MSAVPAVASDEVVLEVRGLTTEFDTPRGTVTIVDGIDFKLHAGEVLGLVGESGSGKSVTLRSIMNIVRPPGRVSGQAIWRGEDLVAMPEKRRRRIRGSEIAMIFQEPMTALNPVLPVRIQIEENLKAHSRLGARERAVRAVELLDLVGIPAAARRVDDYPHQFSGGMRQRAMIAIALASDPKLLLADEPTTALDVTIQDQILKLILDLRDRLGMSVILVTHDLGVVAQTCDRMAVMYAGRIVETGPVVDVFSSRAIRTPSACLAPSRAAALNGARCVRSRGRLRRLNARPQGCAFHPRCGFATDVCRAEIPLLLPVLPDRRVACFHHDEVARQEPWSS